MEVRRPDPENPEGPDLRETFEAQSLEEVNARMAKALAQGATKITIWPKGRPRTLGQITNTDVARAVVAVQERGIAAVRTRRRRQYVNPARQNRNAVAEELGCSPKAARKALKRWRRQAAEIARSPEALAVMSDQGEAHDRGLL